MSLSLKLLSEEMVINEYITLATNAEPTTTFITGMLSTVINIANLPTFIPETLIDSSLNSS